MPKLDYTIKIVDNCPRVLERPDGPPLRMKPGKDYPVSRIVAASVKGRAGFEVGGDPGDPPEDHAVKMDREEREAAEAKRAAKHGDPDAPATPKGEHAGVGREKPVKPAPKAKEKKGVAEGSTPALDGK